MVISVNTIEASVGIFTQPQTLPVYTAIGEFGVGAFPAAAAGAAPPPSPAGALQEAQNRIFIETNLTDVTALADVYLVDKVESVPPAPEGVDWHRWLTPNDMTGTGAPGTATDLVMKGVPVVNVEGGGIITGLEGPQPGRARLRATRALAGILNSPTRNVRVVARTMCRPTSLPDGMLAAVASNSAACWQNMLPRTACSQGSTRHRRSSSSSRRTSSPASPSFPTTCISTGSSPTAIRSMLRGSGSPG